MSERHGPRSTVGETFELHWLATARPNWAAPGQKGAIPPRSFALLGA